MHNFYFTFGSDKRFPYQNGYIVVVADNIKEAIQCFKKKYPNREGSDALNCSDYYSATQWEDMIQKGYYKNQYPQETLYANLAYKRERQLFELTLDLLHLDYEWKNGSITIKDSYGHYLKDSDGDIMLFTNTIDVINSLDYALDEILPHAICFNEYEYEQEEIQEEK